MIAVVSLLISLLSVFQSAGTQTDTRTQQTVWSGVYTDVQASRGEIEYEANCAPCHGANLDGVAYLKGDDFMERWRELDVRSLYDFISKSMPRQRRGSTNRPGSLSENTYVDIMAHIFRANGFPSGPQELSTPAMKRIQIEFKDGPRPLPNGALVRVAGCVSKRGQDWFLSRATDPVRTTATDSSSPEELAAARDKAPGIQLFSLANVGYLGPEFDLAAHANHKMQVRGLLIKQPGNYRINVTIMEMLADTCP